MVSEKEITGINIGGLTVTSASGITGLNLTLGKLLGRDEITGINISGYQTESDLVTGINISAIWTDIDELNGFSFAGYNKFLKTEKLVYNRMVNFAEFLNGFKLV